MNLILKMSSILLITASLATPALAAPENFIALNDPVIKKIKNADYLGPSDLNKTIEFKVWLKLRNEKKFTETLNAIYTPGSKTYHQYLTPKQFNEEFFPDEPRLNKVRTYLSKNGFTLVPDGKKHFYVRAKGTVRQIQQAFQVKMNNYNYLGKIIAANDRAPRISQELASLISGIGGITTLPPYSSKCNTVTQPSGSTFNPIYGLNGSLQAELVNSTGQVISPNMTFNGFIPGGTNDSGYTPAQIQHAYGIDQLLANNINGSGQTVIIIDTCMSQSLQADLNAFTTANNLPTLTLNSNVIVQDYGGTPTACVYGAIDAREETLDLEGFHTMAPNANIILALSTSLDVVTLLSDAIANNQQAGYLFSMSHSNPESTEASIETSLQSAAALGMTVNVSSGDCGDNTIFSDASYEKSVNYPSSSTWVTAVGGTSLFLNNNGDYLTETGWGTAMNISYTCYTAGATACTAYQANFSNYGANSQGFVEGSTGGISQMYPAQSWQQNAISSLYAGGYGLVSNYVYSSSPLTLYRAVPDVSMYAERFFPGFELYITQASGQSPTQYSGGGTSLACPLFTGIMTLVAQERAAQSKSAIGLVSQYLYDLPSGALRIVGNPHGLGNPIAGYPNPNTFQLYQVDPSTGNLFGIVYNFDSSLTLGSTWNDVSGVGSPYAPTFVQALVDK